MTPKDIEALINAATLKSGFAMGISKIQESMPITKKAKGNITEPLASCTQVAYAFHSNLMDFSV